MLRTVEQIEERLRLVENYRKRAEDHGTAEIAFVRTGEELSLLWVLGRDDELATRMGLSKEDFERLGPYNVFLG